MKTLDQKIYIVLGTIVLVPVLAIGALLVYLQVGQKSAKILDFRPLAFPAVAKEPFFYSIGDELKHSGQIDAGSPTLFHGSITFFQVAPDGKSIAIVSKDELHVVGIDGSDKRITPVSSPFETAKPAGQAYVRDTDSQWSPDSRYLYFVRDEYPAAKSPPYEQKGQLWRVDLASGAKEMIIPFFPASSYFFGQGKAIYFSGMDSRKDQQLSYFDGAKVTSLDAPDPWSVPLRTLPNGKQEQPFFSYRSWDYEGRPLARQHVEITRDLPVKLEFLKVNGKAVLTVSEGESFKGGYFCGDLHDSVFLPGERYFLFNLLDCGNDDGQVLLDTSNGTYEELPKNTRVYPLFNTVSYPYFRVMTGGIVPQ